MLSAVEVAAEEVTSVECNDDDDDAGDDDKTVPLDGMLDICWCCSALMSVHTIALNIKNAKMLKSSNIVGGGDIICM